MSTPDDRSDRGATAVEYALMVTLVAGAIIAVVVLLGGDVGGLFDRTNASVERAVSP